MKKMTRQSRLLCDAYEAILKAGAACGKANLKLTQRMLTNVFALAAMEQRSKERIRK